MDGITGNDQALSWLTQRAQWNHQGPSWWKREQSQIRVRGHKRDWTSHAGLRMEGATSQGLWAALEAGKGQETDSHHPQPPEGVSPANSLI